MSSLDTKMEAIKANLNKSVTRINEILHDTKKAKRADDVPHQYVDKYLLAEYLTNVTTLSLRDILFPELGVHEWDQFKSWDSKSTITLRFQAQSVCEFLETKTEKVESNTEHVTEIKSMLPTTTITEKVVHKVTTHYWKYETTWQVVAFPVGRESEKLVLKEEKCDTVLTTSTKVTPQPKVKVHNNLDDSSVLNWFCKQVDTEFIIDRNLASCRTPRRNDPINQAITVMLSFQAWLRTVDSFFIQKLFPLQPNRETLDVQTDFTSLFVPIQPVFVSNHGEQKVILDNMDALVQQERVEFADRANGIAQSLPATGGLIRVVEGKMVLTCRHGIASCQAFVDGVNYIESMLRDQLVTAIGKLVTPVDFQQYMEFHMRKLLKPEYQPRPYSYAVRRPKHYPEGTVSIESSSSEDNSMPQPINTQVFQNVDNQAAMHFALSASTQVSFSGNQYLHCWMTHHFHDSEALTYYLTARARQYSCFVLMIGRMASKHQFDPKYAIILQNKDELQIPLLFEHLPSAGEFRDAISSLSPEQQRFAKAYRSMQLESTLFGLCIVQIKPQLEKLLNLPSQSLTKERRLTQDLMTLFTTYQISSDLVKYDGADDEKVKFKVDAVKTQVKTILTEIDEELNKELEEKKREAMFQAQEKLRQKQVLMLQAQEQQKRRSGQRNYVYSSSLSGYGGAGGGGGGGFDPFSSVNEATNSATSYDFPITEQADESFFEDISMIEQELTTVLKEEKAKDGNNDSQNDSNDQNNNEQPVEGEGNAEDDAKLDHGLNYTALPAKMDATFLAKDKTNALRSSILNVGDKWAKQFQKSVLSKPDVKALRKDEQKDEKNKAFDLLDALSRSGQLPIECTDLHVILPVTHSFQDTLIDTVVKGNVNPIEPVERSVLLVTSLINSAPAAALVQQPHLLAADLQLQ